MSEIMETNQKKLDELLKNFNAIGQLSLGNNLTYTSYFEKVLVFTINGKVIGNSSAEIMFNDICKAIAGMGRNIIFDLSQCPYLSSFFVGSIMELVLSIRKKELNVYFCNTNEIIEDLVIIANIDKLVILGYTIEQILEKMGENNFSNSL